MRNSSNPKTASSVTKNQAKFAPDVYIETTNQTAEEKIETKLLNGMQMSGQM